MCRSFLFQSPVILYCAILLLVSGCTSTAQIVPINPNPRVEASDPASSRRTLALDIIDARANEIIGYRDGTSASALRSTPELMRNLRRALENGYSERGFQVLSAGEAADITMEIRLTEISYAREPDGLLRDLATGVTFEVTSIMPEKTVTATYRDGQTKDTLLPLSRAANAELINQHMNKALNNLLNDVRLTVP